MALSTRITARQTQQLTMTPQLRQAIELLQLSSVDLQKFVEAEIEKNPLLETETKGEQVSAKSEKAEPGVDRRFEVALERSARSAPDSEFNGNGTENLAGN